MDAHASRMDGDLGMRHCLLVKIATASQPTLRLVRFSFTSARRQNVLLIHHFIMMVSVFVSMSYFIDGKITTFCGNICNKHGRLCSVLRPRHCIHTRSLPSLTNRLFPSSCSSFQIRYNHKPVMPLLVTHTSYTNPLIPRNPDDFFSFLGLPEPLLPSSLPLSRDSRRSRLCKPPKHC